MPTKRKKSRKKKKQEKKVKAPKVRKLVTLSNILLVLILLFTAIISVYSFLNKRNSYTQIPAIVLNLYELESDGGFYYQNIEVQLSDTKKTAAVRARIKDIKFDQLEVGDHILLKQESTLEGEDVYFFDSFGTSPILFFVSILFIFLTAIVLGRNGMKYVLPTVLVFFLVFSGALNNLYNNTNIYIASFLILTIAAIAGILTHTKNATVTIIVVISKVFTLLIVLLLNIILFKTISVTFLYYNDFPGLNGDVSFAEYWSVINAAVLFFSFGVSINTTLDTVNNIIKYKKEKPKTSILDLLKEGIHHNQLVTARAINSLFFVFMGILFTYIVFNDPLEINILFTNPQIVKGLILFMNASIAALLIGPISVLVSALLYNKKK